MKKFILVIALASITAMPSLASNTPEPGYRVLEEFKKEFPSAENVKWDTESQFLKANFILAGRRVIAYFSEEGQLEGSIRDIFYDQLPLSVMTSVERRFIDFDVLYIREINNAEGTHYKIRLDANGKKYSVRVSSNGNISDVERVK